MGNIKPYTGFDNIDFTQNMTDIKTILKSDNISFKSEHWPNKGCTPAVPWDIIRTSNYSLFFAKGKMFKIVLENNYTGALPNGIALGMELNDAKHIDSSLHFDDWEEYYLSSKGYWIEDDPQSGKIITISIFIKELEDENEFFLYKWCDC